jgi:hypothetical protein
MKVWCPAVITCETNTAYVEIDVARCGTCMWRRMPRGHCESIETLAREVVSHKWSPETVRRSFGLTNSLTACHLGVQKGTRPEGLHWMGDWM